ncbi:hypothetical protein ABC347_05760 [Sphingomonas sp. 1P06PA]|uniref:hypothetical protein n=1 Tax=Sphingomonas sp. 1P06PA TaxID=554121 RepID=UPI0039A506B6
MTKFAALAGVAMLALGGTAIAQDMAQPADPAAPADATTAAPATDMAPAADATTPSTATEPTPSATTTADSMTTQPATSAPAATADAAAIPAEPGMAPAATASAAPAPGAEGTKVASADATAKVQSGWATYDKGNKGSLTALEFGTWIMAANGQDMTAQVEKSKAGKQANLPAVKVLNATATEFSKADADKSKTISPEELATYLS